MNPGVPPPKVSVVMPVHNRESLVGAAIDSIRAQTFPDWELIVVDDASTDGTRACVSGRASDDDRIRLLPAARQPSIAAVRNIGLRAARGSLIAGMDSDDLSHPRRLECLLAFMEHHPEAAAVSSWIDLIDPESRRQGSLVTSCHPRDLHLETPLVDPLMHPASLIRRAALRAVGDYDESCRLCEDSRLWVSYARNGYRLAALPDTLYSLRCHGDSVTNRPESAVMARQAYASFWPVSVEEYPARAVAWIDEQLAFLSGDLLIWGTGSAGRLMHSWCASHPAVKPVGFLDGTAARLAGSFRGLPVHAPGDLPRLKFDRIAIASLPGQAEIESDLARRGFSREHDYMPVSRLLSIRERLAAEMADER